MAKKKKTQPEKPVNSHSMLVQSLGLTEEVKQVIEDGFTKCTKSQIEKALDEIIPHLLARLTPNCELDTAVVPNIMSFLKTLDSWKDYGKRHNVQTLFLLIGGLVSDENIESVWRSHIVQLITKFVQTAHYNEYSKVALALLKYLFHVALEVPDKPVTAADIKRIKDMKYFIMNIDLLEPSMTPILNFFKKAVISPDFLKTRDGVIVLAYLLSREATLVKTIQTIIRDNLPKLSKKMAFHYGELYFHAWILAEQQDGSEVRKEIEQRCMQDLMLRTMTLKRHGLSMGPVGSLCFAILQALRANRRLARFSRLITDLYEPILWRSLKDSNALVRCNAAQVFFDVFPLEKEGTYENCLFKDKQVKEIKDLLLDECHLVRIISIEGMGTIFTGGASSVLSVTDFQSIFDIVAGKLVNDVADYRVRRAVFAMFDVLVANNDTRKLAIPLIKMSHLKMKIHDEHELVRKAVVKVLLRLKEAKDPDAQFWDVVDTAHIVVRLQEEGPVVGELLAKLLFDCVYKDKQGVSRTINNLIKIIKISPDALMKLFKYSKKAASITDVYYIIVTVLAAMKKWIKEKLAQMAEEAENSTARSSTRHGRKRAKILKDVTNGSDCVSDDNNDQASNSSSSSSEEQTQEQPKNQKKGSTIDNHEIMSGLLNGVSVIWAINYNALVAAGHEKVLNELACSLIPSLLLYYKGQRVYYSVVSFASLIQIRVLSTNCTITGAIMAELREMDENSDPEILKCLVMAMNLWGRTQDIVDLAIEWLNHAFKHEDLNSTLVPRPHKKKRSAKVRFQAAGGKPLLAVKFLDMLFNHVACEHHLLSKAYDMLFEFSLFLERIKKLIERRLENGKAFQERDLSDTFLQKCLKVYLDLINLLHRPDKPPEDVSFSSDFEGPQPLSTPAKSVEIMNWAHCFLVPHVQGDVNGQYNFAADCIEHIMKSVTIALDISRTDKEHALLTQLFVTKLLDVEYPNRFMEMIFDLQRAVLEYSAVYCKDDEWEVFSDFVPAVLKHCSNVFGTMDPEAEDFKEFAKDIKHFKNNVIAPLKIYRTMFGATHQRFLDVCNIYLQLSLELIAKKIEQNENMEIYSKLDDHPLFASLVVKYLLSTKVPVILPWLQAFMIADKENAPTVFAATSLLSTLALSCKSHFESAHLEKCLTICYQLIRALPEDLEEVASSAEELLLKVGQESGCAIQTRD